MSKSALDEMRLDSFTHAKKYFPEVIENLAANGMHTVGDLARKISIHDAHSKEAHAVYDLFSGDAPVVKINANNTHYVPASATYVAEKAGLEPPQAYRHDFAAAGLVTAPPTDAVDVVANAASAELAASAPDAPEPAAEGVDAKEPDRPEPDAPDTVEAAAQETNAPEKPAPEPAAKSGGRKKAKIPMEAQKAIKETVAKAYEVTVADMESDSRKLLPVLARQVAMKLMQEFFPNASGQAVGDALGGKDHTTVIHGVKKIDELIAQASPKISQLPALRQTLALRKENGWKPAVAEAAPEVAAEAPVPVPVPSFAPEKTAAGNAPNGAAEAGDKKEGLKESKDDAEEAASPAAAPNGGTAGKRKGLFGNGAVIVVRHAAMEVVARPAPVGNQPDYKNVPLENYREKRPELVDGLIAAGFSTIDDVANSRLGRNTALQPKLIHGALEGERGRYAISYNAVLASLAGVPAARTDSGKPRQMAYLENSAG
jgi:hypothetical protein